MAGAQSGGTVILNGTKKHEPRSVLDVEKTSGNSLKTSPKSAITPGHQPVPWKSKAMSHSCGDR